jgi:hypothetical protein
MAGKTMPIQDRKSRAPLIPATLQQDGTPMSGENTRKVVRSFDGLD